VVQLSHAEEPPHLDLSQIGLRRSLKSVIDGDVPGHENFRPDPVEQEDIGPQPTLIFV
jgi:hypothetical protein